MMKPLPAFVIRSAVWRKRATSTRPEKMPESRQTENRPWGSGPVLLERGTENVSVAGVLCPPYLGMLEYVSIHKNVFSRDSNTIRNLHRNADAVTHCCVNRFRLN